MRTQGTIIRRECDVPMAKAKGLIGPKRTNLKRCEGKCKGCLASIEVSDTGERAHGQPDR